MNTSDSLLAELKAAGFTLTVEGERLRVRPADFLTDALRSAIREHRDALHALVASESSELQDRANAALTAGVTSVSRTKLQPQRQRLVRAQSGALVLDEGARDADHDEGQSEPPELGVLRVLADFVERGEKVSAEPNAPRTNAWALLRPEPGFPKRAYKASGVLFSAMRQMERDGLIVKEPYRNQSRKDRVAWSLTTKGWERIGKTAPSAPTPGAGGYRGESAHIGTWRSRPRQGSADMSPASLLAELRRRGLTLAARSGQLRVGPAGLLGPELRACVKEYRTALIALVVSEAESHPGPIRTEETSQNAQSGPLRTSVRCRDCLHFQPDTVNPPEGVGRCTHTLSGLPPKDGTGYGCCYPFIPRVCKHYEARG